SSRRRHTRFSRDWSSDVCSSDLLDPAPPRRGPALRSAAALPTDLSPADAASRLLEIRRRDALARLVAHTGAAPVAAELFGAVAVSPDEQARLEESAVATVAEFHRHNPLRPGMPTATLDRKSTRLNSSHVKISYAVFCLKK